MLKISTRVVEPRPKAGSFSGQPKTLWRAGTKYGRVAESPDLEHHIHGLVIISEPDVWIINLFDKSARHVIDPGPSLDVHFPIFETEGAKRKLGELEFGAELGFFVANAAQRCTGGVINGRSTDRYDLTVNGDELILWIDKKSRKPIRLSLVTPMQTQTIDYLAYEDDLPFDPFLFQPPNDFVIRETK